MTFVLQRVRQAWRNFFFAPVSPMPLGLFRILFGLVVLFWAAINAPDALTWFGPDAPFGLESSLRRFPNPCINLFALSTDSETCVIAYYSVYILSAFCVTMGLFTRPASILLYLCLVSFHHRNPVILNGGDDAIRVMSFFLMFAPAGASLSLDALLALRAGKTVSEYVTSWPIRLLQLQFVAIYLKTFLAKSLHYTWQQGTAVYYCLHADDFLRFPPPFDTNSLLASQMFSWATLLIQFLLVTCIWIPKLRYWVMAAGVVFHLGLEWTLNLQAFQQVMLACYALFIDPRDLKKLGLALKSKVLRKTNLPENFTEA